MHGGDIYSSKVKHDFSVNVNPFGLPWKCRWAFIKSFCSIKNYPDLDSTELRKAIANKYGIDFSKILVGNGASEIILAAVHAINPKKAVLMSPCFSGYAKALDSINARNLFLSLDAHEDFCLTEEKLSHLRDLILNEKPEMLFLCNPNNPNGKLYSKETILKIIDICRSTETFVLLDECFMDLTGMDAECSLKDSISDYENLLVLNAVTKTFGVPGLRLGFAFSSSDEMISKIKKQMSEWSVSIFAQKIGTSLFCNEKYLLNCIKKIAAERKYLEKNLKETGFTVHGSDANFILFSCKESRLKEKLLEQKILIRDCSDYENLKKGYYRIAVKTHKENQRLIKAIKTVMEEK